MSTMPRGPRTGPTLNRPTGVGAASGPTTRLRRTSSIALAAALIGGTLSVAAAVVAPQVAAAATTGVAASWSATPNASGFVTATPPAGTVSATLTFTGGGGGSGGTNDNSVTGGAGECRSTAPST